MPYEVRQRAAALMVESGQMMAGMRWGPAGEAELADEAGHRGAVACVWRFDFGNSFGTAHGPDETVQGRDTAVDPGKTQALLQLLCSAVKGVFID